MNKLIIPDSCVPFIRMQRPAFDESKVRLKSAVKSKFAASIAEDFASIEPHLPEHVDSILDIGCGVAAIDVLLKQRYLGARLELLDGDGEVPMGGFHPTCVPYGSRASAEALLAANGIRVDGWHDVGTDAILKADLIISIYSLGFHYPLNTYRLHGLCIMDIRRNAERPRGAVIASGAKHDRCLFRMPE